MRFSLVLATVGRAEELGRFLSHLGAQTHRDFELIVVDQNKDERLMPILEPYKGKFPILHLCSERGLSRARNVGIKHAYGDVYVFPDDDCWYPPDLLERVAAFLENHPALGGITGRIADGPGEDNEGRVGKRNGTVGTPRFGKRASPLTKTNVWGRACSIGIFMRSSVVEKVGGFDETLGVGAGTPWGGAEDIDYPLRAVEAGFEIYYRPDIVVFHPTLRDLDYSKLADLAYRYGAGIGRVWSKHDYPLWLVSYHLVRPVGGLILNLARWRRREASYHLSALRGRWRGWRSR